jgi:hypothetical protein
LSQYLSIGISFSHLLTEGNGVSWPIESEQHIAQLSEHTRYKGFALRGGQVTSNLERLGGRVRAERSKQRSQREREADKRQTYIGI